MVIVDDIVKDVRETARNIRTADESTIGFFRPGASFSWFDDGIEVALMKQGETDGNC